MSFSAPFTAEIGYSCRRLAVVALQSSLADGLSVYPNGIK